MGLILTVKGANFSGLGLGNVSPAAQYINSAGLTSPVHISAIKAFYTSFKQAGFLQKFGVARLYFAGTSLADSINLINPTTGNAASQATFTADNASYHAAGGWTPNRAAGSYASSNFKLVGDLKYFHAHAWTMTPETQGGGNNYFILGSQDNTAGNSHFVVLQRNGQGNRRGAVSTYSDITTVQGNGSPAATGLLSVARNGNAVKLYDGGVTAGSATDNDTPVLNGTALMYEGNFVGYEATNATACTLRFVGYGFSAWTDADELALKNMIAAFNAAVA
jgi:hypothetical protein